MDEMTPQARDSQSILDRARGGDREAFDGLAGELRDSLERHIRIRMGSSLQGRIEPEDVLQETYTRAWKSIAGFRGEDRGALLRWLQRIAERTMIDFAGRQRRGDVFCIPEAQEPVHPQPSPSRVLRREERFSRFQKAIDSLSPEYREVVTLVRIQGLKIREAAERMNKTPNAVMKLLTRALKKLKDVFGDTESLHLPPKRLKGEEENRHEH